MANAMDRSREDTTLEFTKRPYVADPGPRRIKNIKFSMFSGEDVLKLGEVQVYRSQYYQDDRRPAANGLLDAHMRRNVIVRGRIEDIVPCYTEGILPDLAE
ncbi:hypothetical protein L2E82_36315 [Cichorium intybus]|uniref:Uncharacterized protein n=1 Tax=Cichorium intybus TaxID=13427 RepID=A0ACB9BR77_CICIN|nr:hypothetical protein L2E82_36315 [Cichorium intybus]